MQVYDNKGSRGPNSCGYCREYGHNITQCPHVAGDYASWIRMEVPLKDPDNWVHNRKLRYGRGHWFKNPRYWGEWYQMAMNAHAKQEAAKNKRKPLASNVVLGNVVFVVEQVILVDTVQKC